MTIPVWLLSISGVFGRCGRGRQDGVTLSCRGVFIKMNRKDN